MEAEASITNMALNNDRYAADDRLHVEFYYKPRIDKVKTEEAGHPVHVDALYVRITPPGGDTRDQPVDEITRMRFAKRIAQFEAAQGDYEAIEGYRIEEWPQITRAQAEDLRYQKLFTVEQLASAPDVNLQNIMGGFGLKDKAKAWLEQENSAQGQLDKANDLIAKMEARLAALEGAEEKPKRRGRPPKEQSED